MDLGCPLLRGSSDRRLRRRAATETVLKNPNEIAHFSFEKFLFDELAAESNPSWLYRWILEKNAHNCIAWNKISINCFCEPTDNYQNKMRLWLRFWLWEIIYSPLFHIFPSQKSILCEKAKTFASNCFQRKKMFLCLLTIAFLTKKKILNPKQSAHTFRNFNWQKSFVSLVI